MTLLLSAWIEEFCLMKQAEQLIQRSGCPSSGWSKDTDQVITLPRTSLLYFFGSAGDAGAGKPDHHRRVAGP